VKTHSRRFPMRYKFVYEIRDLHASIPAILRLGSRLREPQPYYSARPAFDCRSNHSRYPYRATPDGVLPACSAASCPNDQHTIKAPRKIIPPDRG
jgi:hypothetical protein